MNRVIDRPRLPEEAVRAFVRVVRVLVDRGHVGLIRVLQVARFDVPVVRPRLHLHAAVAVAGTAALPAGVAARAVPALMGLGTGGAVLRRLAADRRRMLTAAHKGRQGGGQNQAPENRLPHDRASTGSYRSGKHCRRSGEPGNRVTVCIGPGGARGLQSAAQLRSILRDQPLAVAEIA